MWHPCHHYFMKKGDINQELHHLVLHALQEYKYITSPINKSKSIENCCTNSRRNSTQIKVWPTFSFITCKNTIILIPLICLFWSLITIDQFDDWLTLEDPTPTHKMMLTLSSFYFISRHCKWKKKTTTTTTMLHTIFLLTSCKSEKVLESKVRWDFLSKKSNFDFNFRKNPLEFCDQTSFQGLLGFSKAISLQKHF